MEKRKGGFYFAKGIIYRISSCSILLPKLALSPWMSTAFSLRTMLFFSSPVIMQQDMVRANDHFLSLCASKYEEEGEGRLKCFRLEG